MKEIPLTKGKTALVDDEDFDVLNKRKWHLSQGRAVTNIKALVNGRTANYGESMHRMIMNPSKGMVVDHKDGNPLNNQRSNLRICTPLENARNSKHRNSKSGYKGVAPSCVGTWKAYIHINKKQIHLGIFIDKEKAAQAYNEAAKKYFGEFASLNELPVY